MYRETFAISATETKLIEDEREMLLIREEDMSDAEWMTYQHSRSEDFFTPVNAKGEPLKGVALMLHNFRKGK